MHHAARQRLRASTVATPDLDARLIVEQLSDTTREDMLMRPERTVSQEAAAAIEAALARRLAGEPVHRILGRREFYGLELALSPATLEPRPDTETLVDAVVARLRDAGPCRILDLGTGSGAIALALLAALPDAEAVGVDLAEDALATARRNADRLGLGDRFSTVRSDWFGSLSGRFRAIVSNPPYITTEDIAKLPDEVRLFDPVLALDGGADGLDAYRAIAAGAAGHLDPQGIIAVEIGYDQRLDVTAVFSAADWPLLAVRRDLAGHDRALIFGR